MSERFQEASSSDFLEGRTDDVVVRRTADEVSLQVYPEELIARIKERTKQIDLDPPLCPSLVERGVYTLEGDIPSSGLIHPTPLPTREGQGGGSSPFLLGHTLFNPNLATIEYAGRRQHLTVRQSDILLLLAQDLGSIVERDFILERVWGNASYANSLALNVQISYLRHLLAADNTLAITSLKKRGYVLEVKTDGLKR
ncbi:MAG: helix-turn-helix domain-containing protein [Bacteroidaceae bacterium]|nr:helix-turn-helix domain-containing protein [Bacteroidaceae bacterium]